MAQIGFELLLFLLELNINRPVGCIHYQNKNQWKQGSALTTMGWEEEMKSERPYRKQREPFEKWDLYREHVKIVTFFWRIFPQGKQRQKMLSQ